MVGDPLQGDVAFHADFLLSWVYERSHPSWRNHVIELPRMPTLETIHGFKVANHYTCLQDLGLDVGKVRPSRGVYHEAACRAAGDLMVWEMRSEEILHPAQGDEVSEVVTFLAGLDLGYDPHPDVMLVVRDGSGRIVATGSLAGKVVKHLAVAPDLQGGGLLAGVFSRLYQEGRARGHDVLFAFTSPGPALMLQGIGFERIEATSDAVLLEFVTTGSGAGIRRYLDALARRAEGVTRAGAIVMNANPFTRGHQYLVEQAASRCERLFLFVVSEDRSAFPAVVRASLIERGTRHVPNITVLPGGDYIISQATFPMYFLRRPERATQIQARLDATVFANRVAPAAHIVARFVGEEPLDPATAMYNQAMQEVLAKAGIELVIVPRLEIGGRVVSASTVRDSLRSGDWALVERLVPPTTLEFLKSEQALPIIRRLRQTDAPH
jgi:[citrate (pro-3S)-lyase] ligase